MRRAREESNVLPVLQHPLASTVFAAEAGMVVLTRHSGLRKWLGVGALGSGGLPCVLFVRTLP